MPEETQMAKKKHSSKGKEKGHEKPKGGKDGKHGGGKHHVHAGMEGSHDGYGAMVYDHDADGY